MSALILELHFTTEKLVNANACINVNALAHQSTVQVWYGTIIHLVDVNVLVSKWIILAQVLSIGIIRPATVHARGSAVRIMDL